MGQRVRVAEPLEKRCVGAIVGFVNWRKGQEKRKGTVFPSLVRFRPAGHKIPNWLD